MLKNVIGISINTINKEFAAMTLFFSIVIGSQIDH